MSCRRDKLPIPVFLGFPCGSAGKEFACNVGDLGSIPGLGRSPGEGKGYPIQYSGLENSMDCIVPWGRRVRHDWATFTSQVALVVKNPPANAGDIRDSGFDPCPGERNGAPLQYSCLENTMDRRTWQATVYRVAQSQTLLKRLSTHAHIHLYYF